MPKLQMHLINFESDPPHATGTPYSFLTLHSNTYKKYISNRKFNNQMIYSNYGEHICTVACNSIPHDETIKIPDSQCMIANDEITEDEILELDNRPSPPPYVQPNAADAAQIEAKLRRSP